VQQLQIVSFGKNDFISAAKLIFGEVQCECLYLQT
jgi:hypothetical protein